jgi:hypothetical protein
MGLWRSPGEFDDYEWFRLADVVDRPVAAARPATDVGPDDAGVAMGRWLVDRLRADPLWAPDAGRRVLLVDLDNLRAAPSRLRARLDVVVELAREADDAAFAGQAGAVRRSRPWLAEFAADVQEVPDGSDLADHALLDTAAAISARPVQFVVVSNDGIFAGLADRGPIGLLSPGADALSDKLRDVANRTIDLAALEKQAAAERAKSQRAARRRSRSRAAAAT